MIDILVHMPGSGDRVGELILHRRGLDSGGGRGILVTPFLTDDKFWTPFI